MYTFISILIYIYITSKWGGYLCSELFNDGFIGFSLQIGAKHIPVCLSLARCN